MDWHTLGVLFDMYPILLELDWLLIKVPIGEATHDLHGSSCARPSSRTCPQETTVCEKLWCGSMSLEQADKFSYREYREGQLRGLVWGTVCCFGTRYPWTNLQKMTRQESSFVHPYPWAPELTPQWKSCGSSLWKHRALNLCLHTMIKKGIGTHLKMKCAI